MMFGSMVMARMVSAWIVFGAVQVPDALTEANGGFLATLAADRGVFVAPLVYDVKGSVIVENYAVEHFTPIS